jgi:hypothetical protein
MKKYQVAKVENIVQDQPSMAKAANDDGWEKL